MTSIRWITIAILAGLICFTIALTWTVIYGFTFESLAADAGQSRPASFNTGVENSNLVRLFFSFVLLPAVIESVGFVLIYGILVLVARFGLSNLPVFLVLIGSYGYLAHGGTLAELGKAAAFVVLGLLFWRSRPRVGVAGSYGLIALAHFVWNGTSILIWHFRQVTG